MIYGKIAGFDKEISRVIMGSANLVSDKVPLETCLNICDTAFDNGINAIDTAVIYGDSECMLGEWIKRRSEREPDLREKLVVITKGAHWNGWRKRLTPYDILSDFHDSLAKLKLDRVDIYILHRDDENAKVEPAIDTLNRLRDNGKFKIFGVSNWSHKRIEEANNYAARFGLEPIRVSSPNFSLGVPNRHLFNPDDIILNGDFDALKWYRENNMPVFAWSSMARGFFAGRVKSIERTAPNGLEDLYKIMANENNFKILSELEETAKSENISVIQAAIKRLIANEDNKGFDVYPIFSSSHVEHVKEAASVDL